MLVKAIRVHRPGGPEAMVLENVECPAPAPGEALVRHRAIGVNFIDVYHRTGAYPLPAPFGVGMEGAGIVEAVGAGVADLKAGDRVAYASPPPGAYAEARTIAADKLVKLPEAISDVVGASIMLKGMTARYLLKQTYPVKAGDWVLVHAAAGGMGLFLCQWARALGARVIGTVSSDDKAKLARANGCEFPILYTREDFVARVKEVTGGRGVDVVYDGVGRDTVLKSLESLALRGYLVNYGSASGAPDPIAPAQLSAKSACLARPTLFHYIGTRPELVESANDVFDALQRGIITVAPPKTYPLAAAAEAHRDLEGRRTTGAIVLLP